MEMDEGMTRRGQRPRRVLKPDSPPADENAGVIWDTG
jgi:hypothetical protein